MKCYVKRATAAALAVMMGLGLTSLAYGEEPTSTKAKQHDVVVSAELQKLVNNYFHAKTDKDRQDLVDGIRQAAHHDPFVVAAAIKRVNVWSAPKEGPLKIFFPGPGRPKATGVLQVPYNYTSDRAHPLVVFVGPQDFDPEVMLARAHLYLGDHLNEFIVVATTADVAGLFYEVNGQAPRLRMLLKKVRELVHVDTDRVYLLGIKEGAEAAWIAGMMNPDLFAGVIAINGFPHMPYPEQSYPLLLENLRHVPVLSAWNRPAPGTGGKNDYVDDRTIHNRLIAKIAKEMDLPITSVELKSTKPASQFPPTDEITELLSHVRMTAPKSIEHWFRYPDQGTAKWLRQKRFEGKVWDAATLSIASKPDVDQTKFITDVLKGKLAYIGGTIQGQEVALTVRHTSNVEMMLPLGVLDPGEPVKVTCNGLTRHANRLPPDIEVMLEDAYDRWEFQSPAAIRLSLVVHTN